METLASSILCAYLLVLVFFFIFQSQLVYFPSQSYILTPERLGMEYEEVHLKTSDGVELTCWYVPAEPQSVVVLFMHGNAGNIADRMDTVRLIHGFGAAGFYLDYRGYGKSKGQPSERGTYLDAEAAWQYLVSQRGVSPQNIIIHGRSLGGPIAAWLAKEKNPAGLILESTFTSIADLGQSLYPFLPVKLLARIKYPTGSHLEKTSCPALLIHSESDEIVPVAHGRKLAQICPERCEYLEITGGHNDGFLMSRSIYNPKIREFLERVAPFRED